MVAAATDIPIGGLLCRTDEASIARCLEGLVLRGFCPSTHEAARRMIVWEQSETPPDRCVSGRSSADETVVRRWGSVRGLLHHDRPLFYLSEAACCWIPADDRVCLYGTPSADDPDWMELVAVVMFELLAAAGSVVVHAGVVTVDGHGILMVGPSGAGKSTLVVLLAQAGCPYTADDLTLLGPRDTSWFAGGTGGPIRLRPGLEIDGGLLEDEGLDAAGKSRLRPRRPHMFRPRTQVDRLILLGEGHGAATVWRPVNRAEALEGLMSEAALALSPDVASRQLVSLCEISKVPAVSLHGGADLLRQPDRAALVFRDIVGQPQP